MKVSICISVYNGEKFLRRTMENVLKQTIDEFEVVLVDDGSVDRTRAIMEEYSLKYDNVRVFIHEKNKGTSYARQTAINHAQGDYLGFVDVDDIVDPTMFEKMYLCAIDGKYDIVECRASQNGEIINSIKEGLYCGTELILTYFKKQFAPQLWLRIYRKSLFSVEIMPRFRTLTEDMFMFPCLLAQADRYYVMPISEILYEYKDDNPYSTVNTLNINNFEKTILFLICWC